MNNDNLISVIDVARDLGIRKQTCFKIIKRTRINTTKLKSAAHRNQFISYIDKKDAKLISDHIQSAEKLDSVDINNVDINAGCGLFYLIQLEPEHDPGRFKLGFAVNIDERLRKHRCSAPFAEVLKSWPCRSLWEKTAIDCVSESCEKIHTEVFRTTDILKVLDRCDKFFSLMPNL